MNEKADDILLADTYYITPNGLDDEDNVLLKIDGETVKIPIKQTTVIRTHFEF